MRAHAQMTVWSHDSTAGWVKHRTGWLQQLREWWMLYKDSRWDKNSQPSAAVGRLIATCSQLYERRALPRWLYPVVPSLWPLSFTVSLHRCELVHADIGQSISAANLTYEF